MTHHLLTLAALVALSLATITHAKWTSQCVGAVLPHYSTGTYSSREACEADVHQLLVDAAKKGDPRAVASYSTCFCHELKSNATNV